MFLFETKLNEGNYNVTSPDGKIVKITLNKTNFKVGDKIVAFLDFSDAQVSCVEVNFVCFLLAHQIVCTKYY